MKKYNTDMKQYKFDMDQYTDSVKSWKNNLVQATRTAGTTAVSNLRNMYMQMEQTNRQAFGELFQGPWLTSQTFDLAKEWGITPQIQDMIRDLSEQNQKFRKWRTSLDAVMKKGLPSGFVQELQKMGEDSQPLLDQILNASPAQVQKLIAQWKQREKQIKSSTKMDFRDEIDRFKKAGGDMGQAIINGFEQAQVGKWFDGWVKTTFPNVISAAVNTAVTDWKAQNPYPVAPRKPVAPRAPAMRKPGGSTPANPTGASGPWTPTYNNDNSQSAVYNFHFDPTVAGKTEAMRQAAFAARNAIRGAKLG